MIVINFRLQTFKTLFDCLTQNGQKGQSKFWLNQPHQTATAHLFIYVHIKVEEIFEVHIYYRPRVDLNRTGT